MVKHKLQQILEYEKRQPNIDLLEEVQQDKYHILREIYSSFKLLNENNIFSNIQQLTKLGYDGKKVINEIRNIIHWNRDIKLHEDLVREPIDMFWSNNNIILKDLSADLLVGKLVIQTDLDKEFNDSIFTRSFFVHYNPDSVLQMGDFCYSNQVDTLAAEVFLKNVLEGTVDPLFVEAIDDGNLYEFIANFFNQDRNDFPEIMAFVIVDK